MKFVILFIFILMFGCKNNSLRDVIDKNEITYLILTKQKNNSLALSTKCGQYSFLRLSDSLLEINYYFTKAFRYRISKIDSTSKINSIVCNAEFVNIDHIDTVFLMKLYFIEINKKTIKVIIKKRDYIDNADTIYVTNKKYSSDFPKLEIECNKKASTSFR